MPKTDPEIITLGAVGTVTVTAPSTLDSATVQSIEGGTVTRAGSALAGGEILQSGETLTFTPATAGGTTYLNVRVDNAEFSGHYDDLDGKPDGTGATGPAGRGIATITIAGGHLTGTYSDGTAWDAGALPAGSGGGLDAEAVQDIVGQMLGETQGHYDDATGTYTINLPAGSSMTDEQVQDIVGALIRAGNNVTVAYDDAGNTLTISSTGGGGSGGGTTNLPPAGTAGNVLTSDGSNWVSSAPTSTGGGSVTSVNSKTGVVVLNASDVGATPAAHATNTNNPHDVTKAQVGLGNVTNDAQVKRSEMGQPSGVATLGADGKVPASQLPASTGGTLDAEAVQDIVGAMLGEVQGHYDDAAGTYIINLPTGGTVTDEQVQDIVGAFIKAGTNVTVNYDDAANTLTVSAVGGGGGGGYSVTNPVPLKFLSGNITTQAAFTEGIGDTNLVASYQGGPTIMRFQAATAVAFDTIKLRGILSDGGTGTLTIRQSDNAWGWGAELVAPLPIGNGSTSEQDVVRPLGKTLNFAAGERFLVIVNAGPGAAYITGTTQYAAPKVDALGTITSYGAENSAKVPINLLFTSQADVQKGVLGPLDPVDFPVSTTAAAPNNSGFMVVDNAAKTASLYWKFSDGSTKKIDLT